MPTMIAILQPIRPELDQPHADCHHAADEGPDIGNETQETGAEADKQAEIQTGKGQRQGIEQTQQEAYRSLAADKSGHRRIDVA